MPRFGGINYFPGNAYPLLGVFRGSTELLHVCGRFSTHIQKVVSFAIVGCSKTFLREVEEDTLNSVGKPLAADLK